MIKELLDYTDEELRNFSIEELEKMARDCEEKENQYNTTQLVEKLLINSFN